MSKLDYVCFESMAEKCDFKDGNHLMKYLLTAKFHQLHWTVSFG